MKYRWTIVLLVAGALPFLGLMYLAEMAGHRSVADLAVADRCVDWAHETHGIQAAAGPEIAAECDRYFRVRSDDNADEDEKRWQARAASRAPMSR